MASYATSVFKAYETSRGITVDHKNVSEPKYAKRGRNTKFASGM